MFIHSLALQFPLQGIRSSSKPDAIDPFLTSKAIHQSHREQLRETLLRHMDLFWADIELFPSSTAVQVSYAPVLEYSELLAWAEACIVA